MRAGSARPFYRSFVIQLRYSVLGSATWFRGRLIGSGPRGFSTDLHLSSGAVSRPARTRGHFITLSGGDPLGVAEDEVQVTRVDEETRALTEDEDRITPPQRVAQQRQPAADREIPEGAGHHALAETLGRDPLDQEARGEECLSEKADAEPKLVRGHLTPSSWRWIVGRSCRACGAGPVSDRCYEAGLNIARRTL